MLFTSTIAPMLLILLISPFYLFGFAAPVTESNRTPVYPTIPCSPRRGAGAGLTFAMPGFCSSYYECTYMGDVIIKTCPPGKQYNSISATCNAASNINCDQAHGGATISKRRIGKKMDANINESEGKQKGNDDERTHTFEATATNALLRRALYHCKGDKQQPCRGQDQQKKGNNTKVKENYIRFMSKRKQMMSALANAIQNTVVPDLGDTVNAVGTGVGGNTGATPLGTVEEVAGGSTSAPTNIVGMASDAASGNAGILANGLADNSMP
ncbi:hypothetical protein BCR43DRAFT_506653 [Syncephalastrum racemosum]|uniref:Chitin-binding type-2 domain-containing protein n=1 Tax=Syncephalastrum racemosum TaxID=13706 RepID=A0A1X2H9D4_SYNRA|nr:hypothetical protein BCR43DRAFT_506653 [Syncephalastrum racemosum]